MAYNPKGENGDVPKWNVSFSLLDPTSSATSLMIQECFKLVDRNASYILSSDIFEDISLDLLKQIISRDNLAVENENEVYEAIDR